MTPVQSGDLSYISSSTECGRSSYIATRFAVLIFGCVAETIYVAIYSFCLPHDIWCAVHTFVIVCIAHLIWCVMHTIFGVENTLCTVCYYIAFCPRLAFTHVNMYNIDTIQLQSSHEQYSKCVVLLSNVFVRYFVADIQSDCHAAPPETHA